MSKISKDGLEQIQVIKSALDSIHDKLSSVNFYTKLKETKNEDVNYPPTDVFSKIQDECSTIANIVSESETWKEVK